MVSLTIFMIQVFVDARLWGAWIVNRVVGLQSVGTDNKDKAPTGTDENLVTRWPRRRESERPFLGTAARDASSTTLSVVSVPSSVLARVCPC